MHKNMSGISWFIAVSLVLILTAGIASAATETYRISYSGKLTDATGTALTGTYNVTFRLYNVASAGAALATDVHNITAKSGQFTTTLIFPASNYNGQQLYVSLQRSPDLEKSRTAIYPVPYALGLRPGVAIKGSGSTDVMKISKGDAGNAGINISMAGANSAGVFVNTTGGSSPGAAVRTSGTGSDGIVVLTNGPESEGIFATTSGRNSPSVKAMSLGTGSPAVYSESTRDVGIYGKGRQGGYFTTNSAGTSLSDFRPGINVSTLYDYNPGAILRTSGEKSPGIDVFTNGNQSPGINVSTAGSYSSGFLATMTGYNSHGLITTVRGRSSVGVIAQTKGNSNTGIIGGTEGDDSDAVWGLTNGDSSNGVYAYTMGPNSPGVAIITEDTNSDGVHASVTGTNSRGVYAYSSQNYGVYGEGVSSAGVRGQSGTAAGVYGRSQNENGVYAVTDRADDKYGIYTPDYLFAKGTQVPAADVAEYMPVTEDVGPGTVMVIGDDGKLQTTAVAYDTGIAGIVSTAPGVSLGTREDGNPGEQIIAVAGRVPCKVDTSNGPIHPRDLLTSSRNPGYAMKATNPRVGTVLGKAMGSLDSGTGTIEVLVTLQ